jgi:hypothetical protein
MAKGSGRATENKKMPAGCQRSDFKYKPCCEFDFASKANSQQIFVSVMLVRVSGEKILYCFFSCISCVSWLEMN